MSTSIISRYNQEFKSFIEEKIKSLRIELAELEKVYKELNNSDLTYYSTNIVVKNRISTVGEKSNEERPYMPTWTWLRKVIYVLELRGAMTTSGIVQEIISREPEKAAERDKVVGSVSATLSMYSRPDKSLFSKSQNERNEYVYQIFNKKSPA